MNDIVKARLNRISKLYKIFGLISVAFSVFLGLGLGVVAVKSQDPVDVKITIGIITLVGILASSSLSNTN